MLDTVLLFSISVKSFHLDEISCFRKTKIELGLTKNRQFIILLYAFFFFGDKETNLNMTERNQKTVRLQVCPHFYRLILPIPGYYQLQVYTGWSLEK